MFYLFHWFRSFLPLHNPIGFGAGDFIELAFAAALVACAFAWKWWRDALGRLAHRTGWCLAALFFAPIVLRLVMLPLHPVPTGTGTDDFSYLLLGDTLAHFRLANPEHPMRRFFETIFVLQEPSYSSIYPLGPGIALAMGEWIFGNPWAGVAISIGVFCALVYWMLLAWTTREWSLLGGALAVMEFGPLSHWMNSFWGGGVAAVAGCMMFGALARLRESWRAWDAAVLGLGVGLSFLARPYESVFLAFACVLFFVPAVADRLSKKGTRYVRSADRSVHGDLHTDEQPPAGGDRVVSPLFQQPPGPVNRPRILRAALVSILCVVPAIGLALLHDKRVTGEWTKMPYMASREQYGVPTSFTTEPAPVPQRTLTHEQELVWRGQSWVHGTGTDSIESWLKRLPTRVRFYRFFLLTPLYLVLPFFVLALREFRFQWVLFTILLVVIGSNFYVYFFPHYVAAEACLIVLIAVTALDRLSRIRIRGFDSGAETAALIVFLCVAHFAFWYGLHASGNRELMNAMWRWETWDTINGGDPDGRIAIHDALASAPGKQLVFVRYGPQHVFNEWVYNGADIDSQRVVWARDLGADDETLRRYYPDRTAWLLEADATPVKLQPYAGAAAPAAATEQTGSANAPAAAPKKKIQLKFEPVK